MSCSNHDINIGQLSDRIDLLSYSVTRHPTTNEEIIAWSTAATVWAKVEQPDITNYSETAILTRETATIKQVVTIRYNPMMIDQKNRVSIDGMSYDVEGVNVVGRKEYMKLFCVDLK